MKHQDKELAKIKSSAILSLGEIEHWNASGLLRKSDHQLREVPPRITQNLPEEPTSIRRRNPHRDIVTILVFSFREIEYGNDRGSNNEKCCLCKFTSGTDPLSGPKCQSDPRIVSEAPVPVEKSFGFEFLWI